MIDWMAILRWIHVLAAASWYGEVIVINFVLLPVLSRFEGEKRKAFLTSVFPKIFKLASHLSLTTVITGLAMLFHMTQGRLSILFTGRWGIAILIGGILAILLTVFHFFIEHRLAKKAGITDPDASDEAVAEVHMKLKIIPRLGLLVLTAVFVLMMFAVRGI